MASKKEKLVKYFKSNKQVFELEYLAYKKAKSKYPECYSNFNYWLKSISNNYELLCTGITVAGYKNKISDKTWKTAADAFAIAGTQLIK